MKILFLDAYFEPEQTSFTQLEADLIECLVSENNNIDIICPTPTRGVTGEIRKKYKNKKYEAVSDNVFVHRFLAPNEGKNPLIRALRYFWCNLRTLAVGKKYKNTDIVFSNSTPPTQGFIVAKQQHRHGRDPVLAVASGQIQHAVLPVLLCGCVGTGERIQRTGRENHGNTQRGRYRKNKTGKP